MSFGLAVKVISLMLQQSLFISSDAPVDISLQMQTLLSEMIIKGRAVLLLLLLLLWI